MKQKLITIATKIEAESILLCEAEIKNLIKKDFNTINYGIKRKKFPIELIKTFIKLIKKKEPILLFETVSHLFKIFSLKKGKKYIIVYDLFYLNYYKDEKKLYKKIYKYFKYNFLHKQLLNRYTKIFVISKKTKNELIKHGIKENKLIITSIGINHKIFKPKKNVKKKNQILVVGSEIPRKNMKNIIKAFSLIKAKKEKLKLIKIGNAGTLVHRENTLKYIKENKLRLNKDIFLLNYVNRKKLVQEYNDSKILLMPTLEEGFGLPIIEAQACKCLVITTNKPPMSELNPYKDLLINPNNPYEIAQKCGKILKNTEKYYQIIEEAYRNSKKYNWKNFSKKLKENII